MNLSFQGRWRCECRNPDGSLAWEETFPNGVTQAGLNDILNVYFRSATQSGSWYAGLIDNDSFDSLSADDTPSSHSGWTENTDYTEGARQQWSPSQASGGLLSNSTAMEFTMSADAQIRGAFLTTSSTKGGTTGTLWATGLFSTLRILVAGQTLRFTYSTQASAL